MILKCITNAFPDRVTYGKDYKVIEEKKDSYYIVDDNNKVATVTNNKYFIDIIDWREKQITKIIKHTMHNLSTYNDYLVSNIETALNYLKEGNHIFNTILLEELVTGISNHTDENKLNFYGEQLDIIISNMTHDFGYNHSLEHKKRVC